MSFLIKKGLASITITSIVVFSVFMVNPHQTHAQIAPAPGIQVPVADTFNFPFHFFEANKEAGLDGILFAAMKAVINGMTSSILDWINSGFEGNPAFIVNEADFLIGAHDLLFESFITEDLEVLYENAPFKDVLITSLAQRFVSPLQDGSSYDLDVYVPNPEAFVEGDFTSGGWSGFYQLTQNPKNNYYGALYESDKDIKQIGRAHV